MDDLLGLFLALLAVAAPLGLAWWLLGRSQRADDAAPRPGRPPKP
jgi:hypothetical protein